MTPIYALISAILPSFFTKYVQFKEYEKKTEKQEWDKIKEILKEK